MKEIKQSYTIRVPVEKVWKALVDPQEINGWGAGPAKMSDKEGDEFSLWGGDIYGKNIEMVENKRVVQDWYGGDWDKPSKVTIELSKDDNATKIDLIHEDVPGKEIDEFDSGWKDYYFGPMKKYLED